MIEVEIRGQLTAEAYQKLKGFFDKNGEHTKSFNREMYMLRDYPGFNKDPINRDIDIRLKNTEGACEIVVKKKASANNVGRSETVLKLSDANLDKAKEIAKAFGCLSALKMHRFTDLYDYQGIEWSVVRTPKGHYYYEAEIQAEERNLETAHKTLIAAAEQLGLEAFGPEQMREFLYFLDREENEKVTL